MAGAPALSVIVGPLKDLLEGLEDDVDVIDALGSVAQSITVLTTTLKEKRQVSSKKRARPSSCSDGQLSPRGRYPEAIGAFLSLSTRSAALDSLSHESVVHIFSYLDTSQSTVLTIVACVCRAWKAAARTDTLWARAAHKLLPFTIQADNEAVKTLLGSVGGYRELIIRYASAIALSPPKRGSLKKYRALRGGFNLPPFQVIFELRDRIADRALISMVGSGRVAARDDGLSGAVLPGGEPDAGYSCQPFTLESMQMPWDQFRHACDLFASKFRFLSRFFVVNNESGRTSLLLDVPSDKGFEAESDDFYASQPTTLPHAAALGLSVRGCMWFKAAILQNQPDEQLYEFNDHGVLVLEPGRNGAAAIGDVLHAAHEG